MNEKRWIPKGMGIFFWSIVMVILYSAIFLVVMYMERRDMEIKIEKVEKTHQYLLDTWWDSDEYKRTVRLHKYHGCLSSWCDEQGQWFITKGGKVARLWDPLEK